MGWFGSSSSSKKQQPDGDAIYVDMEANDGLPVAVAVPADDNHHAGASSQQHIMVQPTALEQAPNPSKTVIPMSKQQAIQQTRENRASQHKQAKVVFVSRTPTVLPQCPCCGQRNIRTRIRTAPDIFTLLAVLALAFLFWPLCWIPLVTDTCRQTSHYCSSCNAEIGHIRSFQDCCVKHR